MKSLSLSVILLVVAFTALALADSYANFKLKEGHNLTISPLNVDELCDHVGRLSGCSGCELGTQRLCAWIASYTDDFSGDRKRSGILFNEDAVKFKCVPRARAQVLFVEHPDLLTNASSLCPADAKKEPILRSFTSEPSLNDFEHTSVVNTRWFDSNLADFPKIPWPVDRTSYYGGVGYGKGTSGEVQIHFYDCADIVQESIVDLHYEEGGVKGNESTILNGLLLNERDKRCARFALAQYISSRCPEYGRAISGVCESLYLRVWNECHERFPVTNAGAVRADTYPDSKAIEAYYIVPEDTPYCLKDWPIYPSGRMEHLAGLDIPVETLIQMYREGRPWIYDCDEAPCFVTTGTDTGAPL